MKTFDVVIVGAGLAGLQCARLLSQRGAKILLVDRKTDLSKGIHTTGIFVRKTLEDFEFPAGTLGKAVRNVTLYSPKLKALRLKSEKDEFRVGKMGTLYAAFLRDCLASGVEFSSATRYISAHVETARADGQVFPRTETVVKLERNSEAFEIKTKVLVGADGAISRVAKDLKLDENKEWIVGYEEVWVNVPLENEPQLHCFLNARLAPGYLAWITNDGEETHIGVGDTHTISCPACGPFRIADIAISTMLGLAPEHRRERLEETQRAAKPGELPSIIGSHPTHNPE